MNRHTDTCEYALLPSHMQNSGKGRIMGNDKNVGKKKINEELHSDRITPSTKGDCYDVSERLEHVYILEDDVFGSDLKI